MLHQYEECSLRPRQSKARNLGTRLLGADPLKDEAIPRSNRCGENLVACDLGRLKYS